MAEQIEINIYLKGGGGESKTSIDSSPIGTGQEVKGLSQTASTQGGGTASAVDNKPLIKYISSQTIDVFLNNTKGVISQNIGIITGKAELQQRVNFGLEAIQQGVNTYGNVMAGVTVASAVGLSTVAGGIIGGVLSIASFGIDLAFKNAQIGLEQGVENRQLSQIISRSGARVNRSRGGN